MHNFPLIYHVGKNFKYHWHLPMLGSHCLTSVLEELHWDLIGMVDNWPACTGVNASPPSATYMRQWIGSALVQIIMACRLFGAKPLSKPMLVYCQLYPYDQTSVKFRSKHKKFHSGKCIWKYLLRNDGNCVLGRWVHSLAAEIQLQF